MNIFHKPELALPRVGLRIIKSIIAVAICFEIYILLGANSAPFYAAIAALQCIQPYLSDTRTFAKNRITGTLVGGFWGLLTVVLCSALFPAILLHDGWYYLLVSLLTGAVIYSTVLLDIKNTAYFSTVVFLSIVVYHGWDAAPYVYVFERVAETFLGVGVGILLNVIHLPRHKNRDVLYVTGIDNTLTAGRSPISDYSRIELNRIIQDGAQVTVSTRQTPAAISENLHGVELNLPAIVMDGAALYDINERRYLKTFELKEEDAKLLSEYLDGKGVHYFTNKIIDDLLVIYYDDRASAVERQILETYRRSPYRNYVKRYQPVYQHVVYIFLILPDEACYAFHEEMQQQPWADHFHVVMEPMNGYPGFTYLKIFSPECSRDHMLEFLKERLHMEKTLIFGAGSRPCDIIIENADKDAMVRELRRRYEPVFGGIRGRVNNSPIKK